jgi:hypothetical protein
MQRNFALLALALSVSGCNSSSMPGYLVAPADPTVAGRRIDYGGVTTRVKHFRVTGPRDWLEQNRKMAPQSQREEHRHE